MGQFQSGPSNHDLSEIASELVGKVATFLMWLGAVLVAASAGFLFYMVFSTGQLTPSVESQALGNLDLLERVLFGGVLAFIVGSTVIMWGEDYLSPIQLVASAVLFGAPYYLPMMLGSTAPGKVGARAMDALHNGGTMLGALALIVLIADQAIRTRDRAARGVKADQLKYGKGIKQEKDRQDVFLGKCWQLPYCRKYVRERCPIFHSKRTCWKELVGCMCEEQVIRDAMENKVISKDALVAATMIPRNNRLTTGQKQERCKSCVIYNEHQRHKYKAILPVMVIVFILVFALGNGVLIEMTKGLVAAARHTVSSITSPGATKPGEDNLYFAWGLLIAFFLLAFSYALKLLEFAIFKLKI